MALQPSWRFTLHLAQYPASLGTITYRWATHPLADPGAFAEGRIITIDAFERDGTDQDGNYTAAVMRVTLADDDGLLRGLMANPATRYIIAREAELELLSEAGRKAGLPWRRVFRGRVSAATPTSHRQFQIEVSDLIGSQFTGFNLDKNLGVTITTAEWPNLPLNSNSRIYPILFGELSDIGSVDVNGNAADKGMVPVTDVGSYSFGSTTPAAGTLGPTAPFSTDPQLYLSAPAAPSLAVIGASGTRTVTYAISALSDYGETLQSTAVTLTTAPNTLDTNNFVRVTWTAVPNATQYRVWGRSGTGTWLTLTTDGTTTTYDDQGSTDPQAAGVPTRNTALVGAGAWGCLVVGLGAMKEILAVYASDLTAGATPKRARVPVEDFGVDVLAPGYAGWPYDTPYIIQGGVQQTVIFVRGPRYKQHVDGTVTIAVNLCARESIGDGSGTLVDQAFPALQLFLNEDVLKNAGTGYRSGDWGPLEAYSDGDPQLQTSAFAECQAITVKRIGGRGYLAAWAICQPETLRQFVQDFCLSFDCRLAANHHGQVIPIVVDDMADPTVGSPYRDRIEVKQLNDPTMATDEVMNQITYDYDYDADAQKYRVTTQIAKNDDAIAAAVPGGVVGQPNPLGIIQPLNPEQLFCVRDKTTADDSRARRITRNKVTPRYAPFVTNLQGVDDDLGGQIRLTHYDGIGVNGDVKTPMVILGHRVDPMANEVTLTAFDLYRITTLAVPILYDETSPSFSTDGILLGDETATAQPPVGAYELR